jgi:hypothetical protein
VAKDDPAVAARLAGPWERLLGQYNPEPFRHLAGPAS